MDDLRPRKDDGPVAEAPPELPQRYIAGLRMALNLFRVLEQAVKVALDAAVQVPVLRIMRYRDARDKSGFGVNFG
jgi:hypothetical protein